MDGRRTTTTEANVEVHLTPEDLRCRLEVDVRRGLQAAEKSIPSAWFYDETGSKLFDEITRLDEYYQTRAERQLLAENAAEIVRLSGVDTLVELGSGTCEKTRVLLDAMAAADQLAGIVAIDISAEILETSVLELAREYPGTEVRGLVTDFFDGVSRIPQVGKTLVAFLGGTIGNLVPSERAEFFHSLGERLDQGDWFLLGCDLVKDRERLEAAYDDAAGVTAQFNRNVLKVINTELDADFDPTSFEHVARWVDEAAWIEMRLRSSCEQRVTIAALDMVVSFADGEELRTEISAKFTELGISAELATAGLEVEASWDGPSGDFLLLLARRA